MEITKLNFDPSVFKEALEGADFVALDCEFSGLTFGQKDIRHQFDTIETMYQKLKKVWEKWFAFQIGLCVFKWDPEQKVYLASPFNFYVYPSSRLKNNMICFQSSWFQFLSDHNMNWDTVFKKGISYWKRENKSELEELAVNYLDEDRELKRNMWKRLGTKSQDDFDEMLKLVNEFLSK